MPFHGGNTGSNPVGDAKAFQQLTAICRFRVGTSCGHECHKAVLRVRRRATTLFAAVRFA
jgi:hypothetical protein